MGNRSAFKILGVAVISFIVLTSFKKEHNILPADPLATWDKKVLKQANTGDSLSYLIPDEKKLIYYTNLCRLKPKLFCQTVVADYIRRHPGQSKEITSLQAELNEDKSVGVLVVDKELCNIARDFAEKMGKEGKTGHADFQDRIKPVMSRYNKAGENCDYGNNLATDAFMSLLIDSSDPKNLAHRKNLLDPKFTAIGVSKKPHKKYQWNYVMDFGGN